MINSSDYKEMMISKDSYWRLSLLSEVLLTIQKEMFFSSKLNGQTLTFWRDKEKTRKEMLELSPEDEEEINPDIT